MVQFEIECRSGHPRCYRPYRPGPALPKTGPPGPLGTLDMVSPKIPREDWAATDPPRIFCHVITESYPNSYNLQGGYGILKNYYPVNVLLAVPEAAGINFSIPTRLMATEITLHALPEWYLPVIKLVSAATAKVLRLVEDAGVSGIKCNALFIVIPMRSTVATYLRLLPERN